MQIAILGLAQSGKTALFQALTHGQGEASRGSGGARVGVVKVPDPRLEALAGVFHPQRQVPVEVRFLDVAAPSADLGKSQGFSGPLLNQLSQADAFILTVRAFADERVPHPLGSPDPHRDLATMNLELAFSDLGIIERRLQRIAASYKGAKPPERETLHREQALLERLRSGLEAEVPLREQPLSAEEARLTENYAFLTAKPLVIALNLGEEQLGEAEAVEQDWAQRYGRPHLGVTAMCAKLEMELSQLEAGEAQEFRLSLGLGEEPAGDRLVYQCYQVLGLISFFTVVSEEVRAWAIPQGTPAMKAAGKIHSDMERGFIRAEVIGFDELAQCGSLAEARKRGWLRLEGKAYPVQDGDVITFLFNV